MNHLFLPLEAKSRELYDLCNGNIIVFFRLTWSWIIMNCLVNSPSIYLFLTLRTVSWYTPSISAISSLCLLTFTRRGILALVTSLTTFFPLLTISSSSETDSHQAQYQCVSSAEHDIPAQNISNNYIVMALAYITNMIHDSLFVNARSGDRYRGKSFLTKVGWWHWRDVMAGVTVDS